MTRGGTSLEQNLASQLECPRVKGVGDVPEVSILSVVGDTAVRTRCSKLQVVPGVKAFRAQLELHPLSECEGLKEREVPVLTAWAT